MEFHAPVPRATVADICARRNRALALYGEAHERLEAARDALAAATVERQAASPILSRRFSHHLDGRTSGSGIDKPVFVSHLDVAPRSAFLDAARKAIDTNAWARLVEITDLERLMDKQAKDELYQQLISDPPEVTPDNVLATLQTMIGQASVIFARGIANTFSALDRRFRSHDGFKIGARVILTNAFDEWGSWSYHQNHRDTLADIERVFLTMEGKPLPSTGLVYGAKAERKPDDPPPYIRIVDVIDAARGKGFRAHQTVVEADYFTVRIFKNGNAHLWFKRDDLVEQVNRLLADYYGEVIPDGQTQEDDGLHTRSAAVAKNMGFYPTPEAAAHMVIEEASIHQPRDGSRLTVLEPSAGTGSLATLCRKAGAIVDCVELHHERACDLAGDIRFRRVIEADFLTLQPKERYDRVVMNPPFARGVEIDHVLHAMTFLKPNGKLVAILPAGVEFRQDRKSAAFRALMEKLNARWRDLPPGSFASVGTYCNTVIVSFWADGSKRW